MTTLEIFNKVSAHLLTQNSRSLLTQTKTVSNGCAYRGADGKTCAVGCLITDEFYTPDLEGKNTQENGVIAAVGKSIGREISEDEISMLTDLQDVHDYTDAKDWASELEILKEKYF